MTNKKAKKTIKKAKKTTRKSEVQAGLNEFYGPVYKDAVDWTKQWESIQKKGNQ